MNFTTPCKHGWVGYCQKCAPKRLGPDPTRLVLWPLMPLLLLNAVLWKLYAHNGWIAAAWFIALIGCLFYARKT